MRRNRVVLAMLMLSLVALMSTAVAADQAVSVEARVKPILTIDGLQFRDSNANGVLDPYEDWRLDTEARIDDLLLQMTIDEKVGLMFHTNTGGIFTPEYPYTEATLDTTRQYVQQFNVSHILDNNNGTPDYLANFHNELQQIAEASRLGVPITFSSDRASNAWGGMVDFPHAAFGTARDLELAAKLFDAYSKEMAAIGYHVTLHPSGVEVFRAAWGEDAQWVADLTREYVLAYQANGVHPCMKHFPTNGYAGSRDPADLLGYFMTSWKAGFEAGGDWVMITNGRGISEGTVPAQLDAPTIQYLREDLGFDGVILTDWFPVGFGRRPASGVTFDGVDVSTLTLKEKYKLLIDNGIDQFGGLAVIEAGDEVNPEVDAEEPTNFPDAIIGLVQSGQVTEARINESARRILRTKFALGLFDDPYVNPQAALEIAGSVGYATEQWEIGDTATLSAARNPHTLALDHALQAAATILLTNDGILPLADGLRVYVSAAAEDVIARETAAISQYATVVSDPALADVALVRLTAGRRGMDDSAMAIVETATDAGLPTIVALDLSSAADLSWFVADENVAAVLMMTYTVGTDHGSPMGGTFLGNTVPDVLASMLFGRAEPSGKLAYELPRSSTQSSEDWGHVPFDLGATTDERMQIVSAIHAGEPAPINLGDPLFMYSYGLGYNLDPDFTYSTLVIPSEVEPGEAFTVSCLLTNNGWDGYTTAELYVDGTLIASKFMAVVGGQSRVVEFDVDIVHDVAGVCTIAVGSLVGQVQVAVPE